MGLKPNKSDTTLCNDCDYYNSVVIICKQQLWGNNKSNYQSQPHIQPLPCDKWCQMWDCWIADYGFWTRNVSCIEAGYRYNYQQAWTLSHVMDRIDTNQEKMEACQEQMRAKMMATRDKIKASRRGKQDRWEPQYGTIKNWRRLP